MTKSIINIQDISKRYGEVLALDSINLDIKENELFGFIGADGAGKTTLFRILTTLIKPDNGHITINNLDSVKDYKCLRQNIGYMPGRFSLYRDLSVEENLQFFASLFGSSIEENYDLIKDIYIQIEPFKKRKADKLSGGMKQKLALCCALIHKPSILVLDEPTTGVDPVSRNEFWKILHSLRDSDITVVVSTPYMDEASKCDRVAFINKGALLAVNTPQGIVDSFDEKILCVKSENMYHLLLLLKESPLVKSCYPFGEYHHVILNNSTEDKLLENYIRSNGINDAIVREGKSTIEDCFIKYAQ